MMQRVKDTPVVDDKTFQIVLSEPYGLVIDSAGHDLDRRSAT